MKTLLTLLGLLLAHLAIGQALITNPTFAGPIYATTTTPVSATYLLDNVSVQPIVASSTRKLKSTYTGPAIQVRRSSDDAVLDIGFSAGVLDEATLLTFVGSGSGYIKWWYDQTGNGNHVSMPTASQQPRIVNAGVVVKRGGVPVLQFLSGSSNYLEGSVTFTTSTLTLALVGQMNSTSGDYNEFHALSRPFTNDYSDGSTIATLVKSGGSQQLRCYQNIGGYAGNFTYNQLGTFMQQFTGSTNNLYVDGTVAATGNMNFTLSITQERLGSQIQGSGPGQYLDGYMGERILWVASLGSTDRTTTQASEKSYFGTP